VRVILKAQAVDTARRTGVQQTTKAAVKQNQTLALNSKPFKTHRLFSRGADRGTGGSVSFSVAVVVEVSAGARLAVAASDLFSSSG
jgi:hypothetical protein